ncbi:MAG: histidinol-phosphatase HisJ family protein [Candidatus Thorarchaeota archaeon]
MIDYHLHPSYSYDAIGSVSDFCVNAVEKGLQEICFTTHLDADPERDDCFVMLGGKKVSIYSSGWLDDYESTIRVAADTFNEENLNVRLGIEVDLYPGVSENLPESFHRTDFDLVVGSVHLIDHKAISLEEEALEIFRRYSIEELGTYYYGLIMDSLEIGIIDVIGHMDIYRRYGEAYYGEEIHELWKPHICELTNKMKTKGVGFEVNTSAWRKGLAEPMPSESLTEALLGRGIKTVTVGSDAHHPSEVGYGVSRAQEMLEDCGAVTVSIFEHRRPRFLTR